MRNCKLLKTLSTQGVDQLMVVFSSSRTDILTKRELLLCIGLPCEASGCSFRQYFLVFYSTQKFNQSIDLTSISCPLHT